MSAVTLAAPKRRHGRRQVRMVWALCDPALHAYVGRAGTAGVPWPHLAQVCRVERPRVVRRGGGVIADDSREVTSYITSRTPDRADARTLAHRMRGHWGIENKTHWGRDATCGDDACAIRSGAAPAVRAVSVNLVIAFLRRAGMTNLAAGLRTGAGRPALAVQLVGSAGIR